MMDLIKLKDKLLLGLAYITVEFLELFYIIFELIAELFDDCINYMNRVIWKIKNK